SSVLLVRFCEPRAVFRPAVAANAGAAGLWRSQGDVAKRRLRFSLDRGFAIGAAAPGGDHESRTAVHDLDQLLPARDLGRVLFTEPKGAPVQLLLNLLEQRGHAFPQIAEGNRGLGARVPPGGEHLALLEILGPDFQP